MSPDAPDGADDEGAPAALMMSHSRLAALVRKRALLDDRRHVQGLAQGRAHRLGSVVVQQLQQAAGLIGDRLAPQQGGLQEGFAFGDGLVEPVGGGRAPGLALEPQQLLLMGGIGHGLPPVPAAPMADQHCQQGTSIIPLSRMSQALCLPARPAGDLRRRRAIHGGLLQGGQLSPREPHPGTRQAGSPP